MARKTKPNDAPALSRSPWPLRVATLLSLLWGLMLWGQPIAENTPRWVLLLIPDETIGGWFDGPVTWRGLWDRVAVVGVAAVVVAQAAVGGGLLLRGFGWFARLARVERIALAAAFGLGIQANVTLLLGLSGGLQIPAAALVVAIATWLCGALGGWGIRRLRGPQAAEAAEAIVDIPLTTSPNSKHTGNATALQKATALPKAGITELSIASSALALPRVIAALFAVLLILRSLLPPAEYDVREYHLQAAKEWWQAGEIGFLPHNIYANMPMAAESQAIVAMMWFDLLGVDADAWWWGALAGKVVIAAYAILTALLIGGVARRLLPDDWGPDGCLPDGWRSLAAEWGVVLALAFPAVVEVASLGLIEPAVASYLAAGLLIAAATSSLAPSALGVGLAGGFAVACKYPAVLIVLPVLAAILGPTFGPTLGSKRQGATDGARPPGPLARFGLARPRDYLTFAIAVGLGGGWWYAKNALLAGNPVYPLLGHWFGGETLTPEKIAQWNRGHAVPGYSLGGLGGSIPDLLWRWRLQGWLVVPAVLWGVILGWRYPAVRWLAASGGYVFAAWWLATHRIERFLIPAAPLAFTLAAIGVAEFIRAVGIRWATVVLCGLAAMNGLYVASPVLGDSRIAVDLRYLRRDDESASSVSRLPEHVRWVNQHLGPEDRVLIVGDAAVFDYEVPLAYSTTFDRSPLAAIIERPEAEWSAALRERGFTHLLVHWGEIERLRSTYGFEERITPALIARMYQAGAIEPLQTDLKNGAVQIYKIRGAD